MNQMAVGPLKYFSKYTWDFHPPSPIDWMLFLSYNYTLLLGYYR